MKQGVNISYTEQQHRKFPQNPFSAEMKERKTMKEPDDSVQKHFMQKQQAVCKFLDEQHEWIQQRLMEISNVPSQLDTPVFPAWVFEKQETEEEEEEDEESEEEPKKKTGQKRKRETKKQDRKGKKKVIVEEEEEMISEEELVDTEEDEELSRMVKEMEKNEEEEEEETGTEEGSNGKSSEDLDLTMEEIVRKKYAEKSHHEPILTPVDQSQPEPEPQNKSSSPSSNYSTGKTPTPPKSPEKTTQKVTEPAKQLPKEKSPTPTETQPTPDPIPIPTNIVFEKETLQVIQEDSTTEGAKATEEERNKAGGPDQPAAGASAPSADALQEKRPVLTVIPKNRGDSVHLVIEELAAKKREDLANTQKFFKKSTKAADVKETPKKVSVEGTKETVKTAEEKGKEKTDAGTKEGNKEEQPKDKEQPETTLEAEKEPAADKDAVKQSGASAPRGASAPASETITTTVQEETTATPVSKKKDSKKKVEAKPTPSRSSNRLKSGAKTE